MLEGDRKFPLPSDVVAAVGLCLPDCTTAALIHDSDTSVGSPAVGTSRNTMGPTHDLMQGSDGSMCVVFHLMSSTPGKVFKLTRGVFVTKVVTPAIWA